MAQAHMLKIWLREARANFLALAVALVMIGGAAALYAGTFNVWLFLLTMAGIIIVHASVNMFNEYSDWRTGIDSHTLKTQFSGGTGTIQEGLLKPGQVRAASWITLMIAFLIGLWLASVSGWPVLLLMGIGGITAVTYTNFLARWTLGELASGIALGSLVVLGAFFVQTGSFSTAVIWASVPAGILTFLLLLLNEFPDAEADRAGGRRHLVIVLGKPRAAALYCILLLGVYLSILAGVFLGGMPRWTLIGLLTFPLAARTALLTLRHHDDTPRLIPAQGMNVMVVLATDFLLAAGFVLG